MQRRIDAGEPIRDERTSLMVFLELWLERVVRPTKREATYRSYRTTIINHLKVLGHIPLGQLTSLHIQNVLVIREGHHARSRALALIVLRRALDWAVEQKFLRTNPAKTIRSAQTDRTEMRVMTAEECRQFLHEAKSDRLYSLFLIALSTGMRQGEIFALEWRDIDFSGRAIGVRRSLDNHTGKIGPLKTKASQRSIAIDQSAVSVLRAHYDEIRSQGYKGPLVWPNTAGGHLSPQNVRNRSFLPIQRRAGIDPPIRFHDLRHTAATLMLAANVHPKIVSERLGHSRIAITLDTYSHVLPGLQQVAATVMTRVLRGSDGGRRGGHKGKSVKSAK